MLPSVPGDRDLGARRLGSHFGYTGWAGHIARIEHRSAGDPANLQIALIASGQELLRGASRCWQSRTLPASMAQSGLTSRPALPADSRAPRTESAFALENSNLSSTSPDRPARFEAAAHRRPNPAGQSPCRRKPYPRSVAAGECPPATPCPPPSTRRRVPATTRWPSPADADVRIRMALSRPIAPVRLSLSR